MNHFRKALAAAAGAALALAVGGTLAAPAGAADVGVASYSGSHGRLVYTVYNPANRTQSVQVAVDTHFGYAGAVDNTADWVSPVGRVSRNTGAVRVQVDRLRLGAEDGSFLRDDYRIAADPNNRNNGLLPALPLNSGTGLQALGYGDWRAVPPCGSPRVASRVYFSVRWADGSLSSSSARSNYVDPNPTDCPPPDNSIIPAAPFRTIDTGDTTPDAAGCQWTADAPLTSPSKHSRVLDPYTADLVWAAGEQTSVCGTSLETTDLGVTLAAGDVVSVDYQLLDGASAAAGSVRLFVDCTGTAGVDYSVAAPAGSTAGTLTVTVTGPCTVGAVGLVYDTSNGGVAGRVRFTDLTVDGTAVAFL